MAAGLVADHWADPDERGNAARVLSEFVLAPARVYLYGLETVEKGEPEHARSLAQEVLALLETGEVVVRQSVVIDSPAPDVDLVSGRSRIRALSPVERGVLVEPHLSAGQSRHSSLLTAGRMSVPSHELEVDTTIGEARLFTIVPPPKLLLALQLHQVPIVGSGVVQSRIMPEWYGAGTAGRPLAMRRSRGEFPPYQLSQGQFDAACETADRLGRFNVDDPQNSRELALRRFNLGCGRDDVADALVEFVISLETLLLPYDEQARRSEMSYRFRMHGAHFIAASRAERGIIHDQLRDLYDIRSRLVHGGQFPRPDEVRTTEQLAHGLAARGLLKAVHDGFPDAAHFRRSLLDDEHL